jgi:hypothetical protein
MLCTVDDDALGAIIALLPARDMASAATTGSRLAGAVRAAAAKLLQAAIERTPPCGGSGSGALVTCAGPAGADLLLHLNFYERSDLAVSRTSLLSLALSHAPVVPRRSADPR